MFCSVSEAAKHLGYSEQHVRSLIRSGNLPAERIGNTWLLESESVLEFKAKGEIVDAPVSDHKANIKLGIEPKCLSFFSGAMGLDLGLEQAGFKTHLACEVDKASRQTISLNRPNMALIGDIRDFSSDAIIEISGLKGEDIDLMAGGPPCQAFSSAGKRQGFNDERGNVFLTFIDRILEIRPKYAVIENVRGLLSAPLLHTPHKERNASHVVCEKAVRGGALAHILDRLRGAGYAISFNLYNSANFGSPQTRERVIIICSRDGKELPFLKPTHSETGENGLQAWRSLRSAIGDLGESEHDHVCFPPKRLKYYKLLKDGQNWRNLPNELQKAALGNSYSSGGGKTGFYRRVSWDKPSPTLVTHPAMPATDLCHPTELRPLSVQEYKRIQEFPDSWEICGSTIDKYKQIGNAVPVSLGLAVGRLIKSAIDGNTLQPPDNFKFSRYRNTSHSSWQREYDSELASLC